MITKEQIEQAAQSYRKRAISSCFDGDDPNIHFTAGAEWALEQCPYSREDMIAFGKWLWLEIEGWEREDDEINNYVKKWEEQK